MAVVTMRQLLGSGVHFGHQTRRWNPKMKRFIFTERGGIYIIDLQQTQQLLDEAYAFAQNIAQRGGTVLFVGTKKQAQDAIREEASRADMPYVNQRWLGGMLTNFQTIQARIRRLDELEEQKYGGVFERLRDPEEFAKVRVQHEFGTVEWPGDVDLDPDGLYARLRGLPIDAVLKLP